MSVNIDFFMQDDSDVEEKICSFDQVTVPPSKPGTVRDIKIHILESQGLDKLPSNFVVRKKGDDESLKDTDVIKAEEHLEACLFSEKDGDEGATVKICSDKAVYILTGTNWKMETIPIEKEHVEEDIPINIRASKHNKLMQPVEFKFAIFGKKPDDDNYWRAERYTLEKEYENYTIKIKHDWWTNERTVYVEGGPELQLDGEPKTFSRKKEASRNEIRSSLVAAGAAMLGVPVAVAVVAAAPVVAPAAAASAGIVATVAVANAGLKILQNKDSLK